MNTALHQYYSLHNFFMRNTHGSRDLILTVMVSQGLGFRLLLQVQVTYSTSGYIGAAKCMPTRVRHCISIDPHISFSPTAKSVLETPASSIRVSWRSESQLALVFREPQSLQFQGQWGCKSHDKTSTALHYHCYLQTFMIWNINCNGDHSLSTMVSQGLGFRLGSGFREPHRLKFQKKFDCKRHAKMSTSLRKY